MPLPGDQLPPGRDWLTTQLRALRRELDELRAARTTNTTGPGWVLYDQAGNIIAADDQPSGVGLAQPHLAWQAVPAAELATIPAALSTTSSSWTTLWTTYGERQNPRLTLHVLTRTSASTTGELRLRDASTNTVLLAPITLPSGDNTERTLHTSTLTGTYAQLTVVTLELRRTSGAGTVAAYILLAHGTHS